MKKYTGSLLDIYGAVVLLILVLLGPVLFGLYLSSGQFDFGIGLVLGLLCFGYAFYMVFYAKKYANHFYGFGIFNQQEVIVKEFFKTRYTIRYDKCADVGIGYYVHGVMNSGCGVRSLYIYFSYSKLSKEQKQNINKLHNSDVFLKVGYSKKFYNYLLNVLPKKQLTMLQVSKETIEKM